MRTIVSCAAASALAIVLVAASPAKAADVKLVCAHDQPTTPGSEGQREVAWQTFKKEVEAGSKGRIEVQVIGAAQLGDMPQILQNLKLGTVDCTSIDAATSGPFIPPFGFVGTPYLIENQTHSELLVDPKRPFFKAMTDLVNTYLNAVAIGAESYSPRSVYNSKRPITKPEDLVGLKLRTMQSPVQVKAWQALGAAPTPVAFAEVYSALQSGVIDGAENQPMFLWNMKHYETVKYYSLTNHMINIGVLTISTRGMNKVPADLRQLIMEVGQKAGDKGRKYTWDTDAEFLERVKKAGIIVNEPDIAPFVAKLAAVQDDLAKEFKAENLLKIIREEAVVARKKN